MEPIAFLWMWLLIAPPVLLLIDRARMRPGEASAAPVAKRDSYPAPGAARRG